MFYYYNRHSDPCQFLSRRPLPVFQPPVFPAPFYRFFTPRRWRVLHLLRKIEPSEPDGAPTGERAEALTSAPLSRRRHLPESARQRLSVPFLRVLSLPSLLNCRPAPGPAAGSGLRGCPPAHRIEVFSMRFSSMSPLWVVIPDALLTALLLAGWFLL